MSMPMSTPASGFDSPNQTTAPARRPGTVTLAYFGGLAAGTLSILGSIFLMTQAKVLATQAANEALGEFEGLGPGDIDLAPIIDEAAGNLIFRAVLGIVFGVLVAAIALATRNAALWARIVMTVLIVAGLCVNGVMLADVTPAPTKILLFLSNLAALAAIVASFLPATNRYAKARKAGVA